MSISFNFPTNPVLYQLYVDPKGGQWKWSGTAWVNTQNQYPTNRIWGSSYVFQATDANGLVAAAASTATLFTIPKSTTTPFPLDAKIFLQQQGTGALTINAASGVTLEVEAGKLAQMQNQYGGAVLIQQSLDYWALAGDLVAE